MGGGTRLTWFELLARPELAEFSGDPRYTVPKRVQPRCARSSKVSRAVRTGGGVHLGMTRRQVLGVVGAPATSGARSLSFTSDEPVEAQPDCTTSRALTVEFEGDRAVAVRAEQITSC
jgi:hypothetical protein